MNKRRMVWILPALLAVTLLFACGRRPGEKLYTEALKEWDDGNRVRARTLLEKSIRRRAGSLENTEAYNHLGVLLWEMGNAKDAAIAFNESYRLNPAQYDILCNLGVALSEQNTAAAEEAFYEASLLNPGDMRPFAFLGISCVKNRQWEAAARNLNLALKQMPNDPTLQTALALTELHAGKPDLALNRLQAVTKQHPGYAPALFNIASIYQYWLKNQVEAKRWFDRYLRQAPETDPFAARFRKDGFQAAADSAGEKIKFTPPAKPNRAVADQNFQKALAYHKKNDPIRAAEWYIKTLEADDTSEQAFYNLGLIYYAGNRMELAADAFSRAVELNPAFVAARYNSALTEYRLGNKSRAIQSLEIVLSQQPGYQPAIDLMNRLKAK